MANFKNTKTGNLLSVKDESTIALMRKSDRYIEVDAKGKPLAAKKTDTTDTAKE